LSNPKSLTDRFRNNVKDILKDIKIELIEKNAKYDKIPSSWEERFLFNHKIQLEDNTEHEYDVVFISNGYNHHFSYTLDGNNITN